ncbi:MAG: hypothetical protein IKA83_06005 [Paludibacteraceae bacterium]|nr:hypothetical protein [Paludibacteraceae bacterium]
MDKKKKIIILVLVMAILLWYFSRNKETKQEVSTPELSVEERVSASLKSASQKVNQLVQENVQEVVMTPEQEEYNLARQKYFNLYGAYPQSSWSLVQINTAIKDKKEVDSLISEFIIKGGDQSKIDNDEDIVTLTEIKTYLSLLNNEFETAVSAAERELHDFGVKIDTTKYNSVAKVNNFLSEELLRREKAWNDRKKSVLDRAASMEQHITNQAKVSWYDEMADDCLWYCGLDLDLQIVVGDSMGWDPLLGGKLGWMKDNTRYLRKYRDAFGAAHNAAKNANTYQVDKYGRVTKK